MSTIYIEPPRVPFVDLRTGKLTREGFLYLVGVKTTTVSGGSAAGDIETLLALSPVTPPVDTPTFDFGLETRVASLEADSPAPVDIETRVASLEAIIAVLLRTINDLQQS